MQIFEQRLRGKHCVASRVDNFFIFFQIFTTEKLVFFQIMTIEKTRSKTTYHSFFNREARRESQTGSRIIEPTAMKKRRIEETTRQPASQPGRQAGRQATDRQHTARNVTSFTPTNDHGEPSDNTQTLVTQ
jgi:hypothetical protein